MTKPKGSPRGFLGLGFPSGASGTNGSKKDSDQVLRGHVGQHEEFDVEGDLSMRDKNDPAKGNMSYPHSKLGNQPARRGWSRETWSQIKPDIPPPELFDFIVSKPATKLTARRPMSLSEVTKPYTKSELLEILGMYPEAPLSAYRIKTAHQSRLDIAAGRFKNEKDPARFSKGGPSLVIDENFLYCPEMPKKLGGPQRQERADTLADLHKLLVRIAHINLASNPLEHLARTLLEDNASQKLQREQLRRSVDGFNELASFIKSCYDKVYQAAVSDRKHEENELYYHPADRPHSEGYEDSVRKQLNTFTEFNVNSWAENDLQDPTIVRSNKGVRILSNDDPDLPFDKRKELEVDEAAPQICPPKFKGIEEAGISIVRKEAFLVQSNVDWKIHLDSQIAELGEEYLAGGKITVAFKDGVSRLAFKLKEDPQEATKDFFKKKGLRNINREEFDRVLNLIKTHLEVERDTPDSPYNRLLAFKQDLTMRELRFEILHKINHDQWYFVLQKIPPIELKPHTTHCAHPYCDHHEFSLMPAEGYRLVFMTAEHNSEPMYKLSEVIECVGTLGRTEDGQMLFCLPCVENLFNGVGLIQDRSRSTGFELPARPQPPSTKPILMPPGLDVFAAMLHSFIRPEMRYTWHEFYTLNSFEYQAFMKWKNMAIRKTMWEISTNRNFNLQTPENAAAYDLVNLFGDDILDMNEPEPSIVIGIPLNMPGVDVDDISTLKYKHLSPTKIAKQIAGIKRRAHPLSQITNVDDIDKSEHSSEESIFAKLDGRKSRIVKPLSQIMTLVDERVQKAWAAMIPPYVPRKSRRAPDPQSRKWPPFSFWESEFEEGQEEEEELKEADGQKVVEQQFDSINRSLTSMGKEDPINNQPNTSPHSQETENSNRDADLVRVNANPENENGGNGPCVTCGTTKSPEWRNGPAGHNTLCNACGIRFFRKRQRRLVPPP